MPVDLNRIDRRRFLRGTGLALAIPCWGHFIEHLEVLSTPILED